MKNIWISIICALLTAACHDFSLPARDGGLAGAGGRDDFIENVNAGDGTTGPCGVGGLRCGNSCVADDKENCGACGHDCTALPHVNGPVDCKECNSSGNCVATKYPQCTYSSSASVEAVATICTNMGFSGRTCGSYDYCAPGCSSLSQCPTPNKGTVVCNYYCQTKCPCPGTMYRRSDGYCAY
jgi:hypothetical protein